MHPAYAVARLERQIKKGGRAMALHSEGTDFAGASARMKDIKPEYREHVAQMLNMTIATLTQTVMSWGFEIVKHLAVINTAGVAGAAAIYSVPAAKNAAFAALPWFLGGLAVTIFAMLLIYTSGVLVTWSLREKVMMALTDQAPIASVKAPAWARIAMAANWFSALGAFALFLVGVCKLVWRA